MRITIHQIVFGLVCLATAVPAGAFHDGGVAACQACHVMHESEDGLPTPAGDNLLRDASPSDLCLSCHGDQVFGIDPLAPPPELGAGNFVFLLEDELNDSPHMTAPPVSGAHAGHSIVAPGSGLGPDPDYTTSPGGSFPSSQLGCTSCHDPHGNDNFRMLYDAGPIQDGLFTFLYDAPDAEGLPIDPPIFVESPSLHTAYRGGMSWWCANCHGQYHDEDDDFSFEHDFEEEVDGDYRDRYDEYDGEANPTGGSHAFSYLVEVAFEDPAATTTSTTGPTSSSRIACTTCHRAHASSAPAATRWDMRVFHLGEDGLESGSHPLPNPYGDPKQLQLCLKCHERDHAYGSQESCVECHRRTNR